MKQRSVIRKLTMLLAREKRALESRDFSAVASALSSKAALAQQLEEVLSGVDAGPDKELLQEIQTLRDLSSANAVQLKTLRDGVARAKARLENLASAAATSGVYGEHGAMLRVRVAAACSRKA
jgi:ABC-type transporter Mla subunit MlaD